MIFLTWTCFIDSKRLRISNIVSIHSISASQMHLISWEIICHQVDGSKLCDQIQRLTHSPVTSGGQYWGPIQTCSLEDPHLVATEVCTIGKRAVRILLECFLVTRAQISWGTFLRWSRENIHLTKEPLSCYLIFFPFLVYFNNKTMSNKVILTQ